MYKFRNYYWSESQFADWVRKTFAKIEKPTAASLEEWKQWKKTYKTNNKFVFWFTEIFLNFLQDIVMYLLDIWNNFRIYVRNRFITKTHIIQTRLNKGAWHEYDQRLLHGAFELFVDFIETEKNLKSKHDVNRPWWDKLPYSFRFFSWRSPENSIKYLEWEMSLKYEEIENIDQNNSLYGKPTNQAKTACEQLELYIWWKFVRPYRPDPYELAGYYDYKKNKQSEEHNKSWETWLFDPHDKQLETILNKAALIEDKYIEEDNEMLLRLIKIRNTLWV